MSARYDALPYDCRPIVGTAPEQLALASWIAGGPRPEWKSARVLEIGCGDGANLLPMAWFRPECELVGIDTSRAHIEAARAGAAELELENVRFELADVRAIGESLGEPFDFVVCHGVLSWVPFEARHGILAAIRERLAPGGVAYLSYNVFPGWKIRGMVRELLLGSVDHVPDLAARAHAARELAAELRELLPASPHPYAALMAHELDLVTRGSIPYVAHEYLSPDNWAYYFRELAGDAARHGLDYVGDARSAPHHTGIPNDLRASLAKRGLDRISIEQTCDILCNRQFRASLFCHEGDRRAPPEPEEVIDSVYLVAQLTASEDEQGPRFQSPYGHDIRPRGPLTTAALGILAEAYPRGMSFETLVERAVSTVSNVGGGLVVPGHPKGGLRNIFLTTMGEGAVAMSLRGPDETEASAVPKLPAITRFESKLRTVVTTPNHEELVLQSAERRVAVLADGTRSIEAIEAMLLRAVESGNVPASFDGERITDRSVMHQLVSAMVSGALRRFRHSQLSANSASSFDSVGSFAKTSLRPSA